MTACHSASSPIPVTATSIDTTQKQALPKPLKEKVLTAAQQMALTPDAIIESLKAGNQRYMTNDLTARDHSSLVRDAVSGQFPKAVILSCMDSRVPVEDVFDKGIGDLFICRVAGNCVSEDMLGSMEYGCKVAGAKLIVVMGHRYCGAVKSAIDEVKMGNITAMLAKIQPAILMSKNFNGVRSSKNPAYVNLVAINNVKLAMAEIRAKSKILREMEDRGEIKIIGAGYDLDTGQVTFFE